MNKKAKVYLVCGRTGAGKTTYAKKLELELPAYRISHDKMLIAAYGDEINKDDFEIFCNRINCILWDQIERLSIFGIDIILEGWDGRKLRDKARKEIERIGVDYEFIYIECPQEIRLQRVKKRNQRLSGEVVFISEADFYRMEHIHEKFDEGEKYTLVDNSISQKVTL